MPHRGFHFALRLPKFGVALMCFCQTEALVKLLIERQRFIEIFLRQMPILLAGIGDAEQPAGIRFAGFVAYAVEHVQRCLALRLRHLQIIHQKIKLDAIDGHLRFDHRVANLSREL